MAEKKLSVFDPGFMDQVKRDYERSQGILPSDEQAVVDKKTELDNLDDSSAINRMRKSGGVAPDDKSKDAIKGAQYATDILGPEGLGRMGVDQAQTDIEARAKEMSQGYSSAEALARQEKGTEAISGGTAANMRGMQAALSRSGLKGQQAGAQMGQLAQADVKARGNLNRDLIIENRAAQERGMQGWGDAIQNRQANEKFDLGQVAKEKDFIGQGSLGFMNMGVTERSADKANAATIASAKAQKSNGGKVICTELHAQGFMSDEVYALDKAFGQKLVKESLHIYLGYYLWAQYVVLIMQKSKLFTKLISYPCLHWAEYIAGKDNRLGEFFYKTGAPVCGIIGKIYLAVTKESILKQS